MSEKAKEYRKSIELLLSNLEKIYSIFEEEIDIKSLYALQKIAEEGISEISQF